MADVTSYSSKHIPQTDLTASPLLPGEFELNRNNVARRVTIANEIIVAQNSTKLAGIASTNLAPGHHASLIAERISNNNGKRRNKYGLEYSWRLSARNFIEARVLNTIQDTGEERTKLGFGFQHHFPTRWFESAFQLGYKNAESANTQLEGRFIFRKQIAENSIHPLLLTASIKWRQRETADEEMIEDIGGTAGVRINLNSRLSIKTAHNIRDDIRPEGSTVAATYNTRISAHSFSFRLGATSENTIFFGISAAR